MFRALQKIAYEHVSSQFANDGKTRANAFENSATNNELVDAHAHCFKSDRILRSPLVNGQIEKSLMAARGGKVVKSLFTNLTISHDSQSATPVWQAVLSFKHISWYQEI